MRKKRPWTDREDALLQAFADFPTARIAKFLNRTPNAVYTRRSRLQAEERDRGEKLLTKLLRSVGL